MDAQEIIRRIREGWAGLKSNVELLCHVVFGTGILALVIDSWLKLSAGKQREAIGLLASGAMGAAEAFLYIEQWLAVGGSLVHVFGFVLGRADRARCAKAAAGHAVVAALWWAALTYGDPFARRFGFPAQGLEEQLLSGAFCLVAVYHALDGPERLRIGLVSATTAASRPGDLPPIGGVKL